MVRLSISRNKDETWIDAALRKARVYGIENEVREYYDAAIASGYTPGDAAFHALYSWDLTDLVTSEDADE